jgi:hypothetical protein
MTLIAMARPGFFVQIEEGHDYDSSISLGAI